MDERFCDVGRGVTLCYETFGDPADPPLLLVMGLGMQMVGWHEDFCSELAGRGFHVVRFDNRDAGRSTHFPGRAPTVRQLFARRFAPDQYTLADMAEDAAGLLRELDLAPAHVVGASMGGMIAQTLAAGHPESVRSLVSIMSNTGSRVSGQPAVSLYRPLLTPAPAEREAFLDHVERLFTMIGSPGRADVQDLREVAALSFDRARDPAATVRQLAAILKSGNRTRDLRRIAAPTLVVHGSEDRLVRPSGGRATARAIPGARLLTIKGMGHDLPRAFWPQIVDAIAENAQLSQRPVAV
jgi:pimeloyl-ACP methyl ester carboxylesterase